MTDRQVEPTELAHLPWPAASRRARIVATLGPATSSAERIGELVEAGLDVARLNLSHGSHAEHATLVGHVRAAARRLGRNVAVLADLQGPKIRLGRFAGGRAWLEEGGEFVLDAQPEPATSTRAATTYPALAQDAREGDVLLLDDGRVKLEVVAIEGESVRTRIVVGGELSDHKGIHLPGSCLSAPALSEKDARDLEFALACDVDWVALSFVRRASDVEEVRKRMRAYGRERPVLAKIEKREAVLALEAIADAFDGLMVARGDLGVELPLEQVPSIQRRAIRVARSRAKPVIVATQMLESMVNDRSPTRAEVSDVSTAVLDGADALMLSAETSIGKHPVETLHRMRRIIEATEADVACWPPLPAGRAEKDADAVAQSAVELAERLGGAALCAFTLSGSTACLLARHRSSVPVLALTPSRAVGQALALCWGVEVLYVPSVDHTDRMIELADRVLLECGRFAARDRIVLVAGSPVGTAGRTNLLRLHALGQ